MCRALLPGGAALVALSLLGCRIVGPDYHPPALPAPAGWTTQAAGTTNRPDPQSLARWWEAFNDPVLTGLVAEAQQRNLDLKQAEARLRQARAERNQAQADFAPTVAADASARRTRGSAAAGGGRTTSNYSAALDATWELDLFGGKRRAAESAEASLQASEESLRDVLVSLEAEVALNYVQYRASQSQLAIAQTNLQVLAELHTLTCWRQQASLATQIEVDEARATLEQTRAGLPALRTTRDQAANQLAVLLGVPAGTLASRLETGAAVVPAASETIAVGVPADLLRQRPDVRAAERALAAQTAQIGVSEAARYPTLTLSGSVGLEALDASRLLTTGARTAQGVLQAGWTAFDAGRLREQVNVQTARQEETLAAYEASVLNAFKDVENALVAYANELARQRALQESRTASASAASLARARYATGLVDFQTVLTTQQSLLAIDTSLATSRAEVSSNLIRLYKALGGGWTPPLDK
jgi:NodT family efflux transporter outer membrane factor (OMF) lipoprotein